MNLIEADAKALLSRHGLPIPRGALLPPGAAVPAAVTPGMAVKAQLFATGRGKAGLVKLCEAADLERTVADIRGALTAMGAMPYLLLEEKLDVVKELYLAVRVDDVTQQTVIVFSATGGMEVESSGAAPATFGVPPGRELRADHLVAFFRAEGIEGKALGSVCRFAAALHQVFLHEDAELLEINPLGITGSGAVIAMDAKAVLDDDAHFRHTDRADTVSWSLARQGRSALEARAAEHELTFIPLDGEIALLSGGAGNGMMLFDALADAGYRPANFVDTIGGSGAARWQQLAELVFEHARNPQVQAIVAYFTLSVTPLRYLVDGLLGALAKGPPPKPIVIGVMASGAAESMLNLRDAQRILRDAGLDCLVELPDVVERLQATVPPR